MPDTVNWKSYLELFPDRYILPGPFDEFVKEKLSGYEQAVALDIGGGREGTAALQRAGVQAYLADPFIERLPIWMDGNLGNILTISQKFDFIVARGSFNYLTRDEIRRIPSLLNRGGSFVFNTFAKANTGSRRFVNSRTGTTGEESYAEVDGMVRHRLLLDGSGLAIYHSFFIYPEESIREMLGEVEVTRSGGNSLHVRLKVPSHKKP